MNLHLPTLFEYLRRSPFGGTISTTQVKGVERLLAACEADGVTDERQVAYLLASVFHETGARMQPVRETFATSDGQAIRRLDAAMAAGRLRQVSRPYWRAGMFGRGDLQVTHERNYRKVFEALGLPADTPPARMLEPEISARAAVVGMRDGLYTGHRLDRYFADGVENPEGARKIVNGTDKASLIAGYYRAFLDSIKAAKARAASEARKPEPVPPPPAPPADGADLKKDPTAIGGVLAGLGGLAGIGAVVQPILQGIASPWAFAAFALIAVGVFLVLTGRVQLKLRGGV